MTRVELDIHHGDNLEVLASFEDGSFDLIYIDPPFNTGRTQSSTRLRTVQDSYGQKLNKLSAYLVAHCIEELDTASGPKDALSSTLQHWFRTLSSNIRIQAQEVARLADTADDSGHRHEDSGASSSSKPRSPCMG